MATESELDRALARAVLCRAMKLGLQPPNVATVRELSSAEGRRALPGAALVLEGGRSGSLTRAVALFFRTALPELAELRGSFAALFGHTLRGRVCPYEGEYGRQAMLQQANELASLAGFYRAFGLKPAHGRRERPDHVACELEFYEFLARKEAYALARDDREMAEVTRDAARRFLRDHLGRFGRAFAVSLGQAGGDGFYGRLGRVCEAFLAAECRHQGVPLGPEVLELRAADLDDAPMACGTGSDVVEIGG